MTTSPLSTRSLVGQTFGRLTVLRPGRTDRYQKFWICVCGCGQTKEIRGCSLTRGSTMSCGCLHKERAAAALRASNVARGGDLTGQRFGRLQVVGPAEPGPSGESLWRCTCSCGTTVTATTSKLRRRRKQSCGCMKGGPDASRIIRLSVFGERVTLAEAAHIAGISKPMFRARLARGMTPEEAVSASRVRARPHCGLCGEAHSARWCPHREARA